MSESTLVDFLVSDEVTASASPAGNAPDVVKPPAEGQPTGTPESSVREAAKPDAAGTEDGKKVAEGKETKLSPEDFRAKIAAKLTLGKTEPETLERVLEQRAEITREAKRLAAEKKEFEQFIADKFHLKSTRIGKNGKQELAFIADKEYVEAKAEELLGDMNLKLTKDQEDKLLDDPEAVLQEVHKQAVAKAVELLGTRPGPTARADEIELSDQELVSIRKELFEAKDAEGELLLADIDILEPLMDDVIQNPAMPESLAKLMATDKEAFRFATMLIHGYVRDQAAPLLETQRAADDAAKVKQTRAAGDVTLGSESGKSGAKRTAAITSSDEIDEMFNLAKTGGMF